MNEDLIRLKMQEILELVIGDIGTIRTGRATPALVEEVTIDAYGGQSRLKVNELASISAPDTQTLVISPFDKSIIGDIKKGIEAANLGFNLAIDGEIIRIALPAMTTEDREKYTRLLSQKLESGRVMIRQARAEAMKEIKKAFEDKELSEDEKFAKEKKLQEITDEFVEKIEKAGESKRKELLQI